MRARALTLLVLAAAVGCGGTPDPGPVNLATEKAAEEEYRSEAAREGTAGPPKHNPDDD